MVEKLLSLSQKDIKIPENKCIFSNDELYKELFKNGELEAKKEVFEIRATSYECRSY